MGVAFLLSWLPYAGFAMYNVFNPDSQVNRSSCLSANTSLSYFNEYLELNKTIIKGIFA